jgi:hypothetical protein
MIFLTLVYFLNGLPAEWYRFSLFCLIAIIVCLVAEGIGLAIGCVFNVTVSMYTSVTWHWCWSEELNNLYRAHWNFNDKLLQTNFIKTTSSSSFFSFFFYWHYNPLWVLAFSVIFIHSALSSHCFLHRLTPIICISSSMSAIHLFRGLPLVLVPIGFHCNILLGVLLSTIRITWPSQAILLLFINLNISAFPISSFSS